MPAPNNANTQLMSATGGSSDLTGKAAGGRTLIAVVYADMVGYNRLIGLGDAGMLRRLRTLRRALIDLAIREHGGRIDSIDGAIRCAVKGSGTRGRLQCFSTFGAA